MRNSFRVFCGAVFLAALASAVPAFAQFSPVNPDELKMTADPKAPGADAVFLDIEEVDNDPVHFESYYARIKVLTEKGKELATVTLPYLKSDQTISDIAGRTIHPDGTIVPLTTKAENLLVVQSGDLQVGRKVFTLPSVEVGSILEYRYRIAYNDDQFSSPTWNIQSRYFVHNAHYTFTPFPAFMPKGTPGPVTSKVLIDGRGRQVKSLIWWPHLPPGDAIKTSLNGSYSLDVANIPAAPDEEWMPPTQSELYRVSFYYSFAHDAADFWKSEGKLWSKDVDKFASPSDTLRGAVSGLIAPSDSDLVKAQKLYAAVQSLDNTDYSRRKSSSERQALKLKAEKRAEDVWAQKSGSSEEIAMLYLAMLRTAGLTAYALKVVDRNQGVFDPSYQSLDQLNTTLVVVQIAGQEYVLDPGEKMCPFATLNWRHAGVKGLYQSSHDVEVATTEEPSYNENTVIRTANLSLDAHGGVTGSARIVMTGQIALRWRQAALRRDITALKKQFDRDELQGRVPEGVEAHVDHFLALDQPGQNLMATLTITGSMGVPMGKRLLLPALFFETRAKEPFVSEATRQEPVDMHYAERLIDDVTYQLPAGFVVEGAPGDTSVPWKDHAFFVVKSKSSDGQIEISNLLARAFSRAKPEEYPDLRGFYQKVAAAEQAQLVLKMAAPATASEKKVN